MTTETQRTLEEIQSNARFTISMMEWEIAADRVDELLSEAHALGAASRASPEARPSPEDYATTARLLRLNCLLLADTDGAQAEHAIAESLTAAFAAGRASPKEGRALRDAHSNDIDCGCYGPGECKYAAALAALRSPPAPSEETRVWVPHARSCLSLGTPGLACDCGRACVECDGARAVDTVDRRIPCPSCTVTAAAPPPEDSGSAVKDDEKLSPQPCRKCGLVTVYYTEGGDTTGERPMASTRSAPASGEESAK